VNGKQLVLADKWTVRYVATLPHEHPKLYDPARPELALPHTVQPAWRPREHAFEWTLPPGVDHVHLLLADNVGETVLTVSGKQWVRYHFDVANKDQYPDDMFAQSPNLPPCGTNTKAARTWVDLFDQSGHRLNGFCALGKSSDLSKIWFALEEGVIPPSWIYIEMNDRKTNTKYKSNLADTTL